MSKRLPVASPDVGPLEERYVNEALRSGWISSIGAFVDRFEKDFARFCEVDHAVSVANGTDALFIALRGLGVGPGDEVIVPTLTFAAVAAVVVHNGAEPVFVDVDPEHWNMDPAAVERALSPRTKAIVAVHSYGHPADVDALAEIARARGLYLVEDAAEAHGARCRGRRVGSIGDVGCFSFYGNKVMTTGEGGMITTRNADLARRMRFLKDHAMDPARRYYHTEAGFNCRMTNLQAALGCAQLERIDELLAARRRVMDGYRRGLGGVAGLQLNPGAHWAEPVVWMVCAAGAALAGRRDDVCTRLREAGIDTRPFFVPNHELPPYRGRRVVAADGSAGAPVAIALGASGINLPSGYGLDDADVDRAAAELRDALAGDRP